jgi:hypothetical protein
LPNETVGAENEIKKRADVGKENGRPNPGEGRSRRLVAQENVRNRQKSEQISEPDERPMHSDEPRGRAAALTTRRAGRDARGFGPRRHAHPAGDDVSGFRLAARPPFYREGS